MLMSVVKLTRLKICLNNVLNGVADLYSKSALSTIITLFWIYGTAVYFQFCLTQLLISINKRSSNIIINMNWQQKINTQENIILLSAL